MQLAMEVCSRTGQVAAVPARNWFAVPLTLEQFVTPRQVGIAGILDLYQVLIVWYVR
jgi:hypothetical protein